MTNDADLAGDLHEQIENLGMFLIMIFWLSLAMPSPPLITIYGMKLAKNAVT